MAEQSKGGGWFSRFSSGGREDGEGHKRLVEEAEATAQALNALRNIHDQTENDNQQLRAEVALLENSAECVQEELSTAQRKLAEAEKALTSQRVKTKSLEKASRSLEARIDELTKTADAVREQEREAAQSLAEERRKATLGVERQRRAQREVERQYERRDQELATLRDELEALRATLSERDDALVQARDKLEAAESRAEQLGAEREQQAARQRQSEEQHSRDHSQWAEELQTAEADRDRLGAAIEDQADEHRKARQRWLDVVSGMWAALEYTLGAKACLALPAGLGLAASTEPRAHSSDLATLREEVSDLLRALSLPANVSLVQKDRRLELTLTTLQADAGALPAWAGALAMHQLEQRMGRPLRATAPRNEDEDRSLVVDALLHDA